MTDMELMSCKCRICGARSRFLFKGKILEKYDVSYFKCEHCCFIQTEEPYWINEAYNSPIANLDIGYVSRNLANRNIVSSFLNKNNCFDKSSIYLDYGGGYGLFVRLMRDLGFNFYRQDIYCENLFAVYFDTVNIIEKTKFEMLTCFEVFEHLIDPIGEVNQMLNYSDSIFFSTALLPSYDLKSTDDWWYFAPETGQHVAFYTKKSLQILSEKFGLNFYTDDHSIHLMTSKFLNENCLRKSPILRIYEKMNSLFKKDNSSLLKSDFLYIKSILQKNIK